AAAGDVRLELEIAGGAGSAAPAGADAIPLRAIDAFAEALLVAALLGELGLVLLNVLARAFFRHSFLWADEAARLSLSILAFIGGAVAYRRRDHAFVRIVPNLLPKRAERACPALADVILLFASAVTGIASAELLAGSWSERTPILQLPAAVIGLPLPLGMTLLAIYALNNLKAEHRWTAWKVGVPFLGLIAAAAVTQELWLAQLGS